MCILAGMKRITYARKLMFLAYAATVAILPLTAQDSTLLTDGVDKTFVIREEKYSITGRTKPASLQSALGEAAGLAFATATELEQFAEDRARKLENLRAFKKSSVTVQWVNREGETGTADLLVQIEDGTAFVPIPFAFYNSNDGLQAGTILNVPNIAGSLQNLFVVALYIAPPAADESLQWTNPNFILITTLSGIQAGPLSLALAGSATRTKRDIAFRGETGVVTDVTALSGTVSATGKLTETLSNTLSFRLAGSPERKIAEIIDSDLLAYGPIEISTEIRDQFSIEEFDWNGNFRQGWKASVGAGYTRTVTSEAGTRNDVLIDAEAAGYQIVGSVFNPGASVYAFANTGDPLLDPGQRIRGIRNSELAGNMGVFLRTGVQTRIARFKSSEINVAPALDLFWARVPGADDYEDDAGAAVGAEFLFLFDSIKSLPIKLGFAWDCRPESRVAGGKRLEVDFNFSLSY